jgi:hypothetical protein
MKITSLLLFCLLSSAAAFGQFASLGTAQMSSTYQMIDHAHLASPQPLAQERSLLGSSGGVYIEHGELPLWEVAPVHHDVPLGDVAREQKKEHAMDKKARITWEN